MLIMGANSWEVDFPEDMLVEQSLEFSEALKSGGVAELKGFWINHDRKLLWCYWETENLDALQAAFDAMNAQSGLSSELITGGTDRPGVTESGRH